MSGDTKDIKAGEESGSSSSQNGASKPADGAAPKRPSKLKQWWAKTGLDLPTVLVMMKAALPPTLATAAFQSTAFASEYTTLGYLISIISILGFCIMPRAKFLQTMLLNLLALCVGAAVALLSIWSGIKAREHTTPPGAPLAGYNSSASAVNAVWLFFQVYLINSIKSAMPQFNFPSIIYAIFALVSAVYGPQFSTTAAMLSFVQKLLVSFLTAFAFAAATSLLVLPTTTRTVVFKKYTGYLMSLRGIMKAQNAYLKAMQSHDMFQGPEDPPTDHEGTGKPKKSKEQSKPASPLAPEADAYQAAISGLMALHTGLAPDIAFAKREVAYGKLSGTDIGTLFKLLQAIALPLISVSSIIDVFRRIGHDQGWDTIQNRDDMTDPKVRQEHQAVGEWQSIMRLVHKPFTDITDVMDEAIQHVLLRLEFQKPPKTPKETKKGGIFSRSPKAAREDVEKGDAKPEESTKTESEPGSDGFHEYLREKCRAFWSSRGKTLQSWCDGEGIDLSPSAIEDHLTKIASHADESGASQHDRDRRQVFGILYMEYLLWSAAKALLDLVEFTDAKHTDGTMSKSRLHGPNPKRLRKWAASMFGSDNAEDNDAMSSDSLADQVSFGDAFKPKHDPDHLPPTNWLEKLGDQLRAIPRLLRSEHSVFGFRAACATMSIGIVAFLESSYAFFLEQRLIWAMIMIAFSMTRSTGESAFAFLMRVAGTLVAMIASYVVYYIVDGRTPGVIVFLFIWVTMCFYVVLKMPRFVIVGILSAVTTVLVIGYELQVEKIGVQAATSNGQPYYPVYELAPYRLACVAGGLLVAYIWTIFPYPASQHTQLRRELGATIGLLAHYYSVCHETAAARVRGDAGDPARKGTPAHALQKARTAVFAHALGLIAHLKASSEFTRWQIHVGGRFPKPAYDALIARTERILRYTALVTFASTTWDAGAPAPASPWLAAFRALLRQTTTTSNDVTALLSLLGAALAHGSPLPPALRAPPPFRLVRRLEALDPGILAQAHVAEPGYAAFAVMTIATRSIAQDLDGLLREVRALVGELDFSFRVGPGEEGKGKRE